MYQFLLALMLAGICVCLFLLGRDACFLRRFLTGRRRALGIVPMFCFASALISSIVVYQWPLATTISIILSAVLACISYRMVHRSALRNFPPEETGEAPKAPRVWLEDDDDEEEQPSLH